MDNATVYIPPIPVPAPVSRETAALLHALNEIATKMNEMNARLDATNLRLGKLIVRNY